MVTVGTRSTTKYLGYSQAVAHLGLCFDCASKCTATAFYGASFCSATALSTAMKAPLLCSTVAFH
eukprot:scaffold1493_cov389-Pinguiococcus_pyrenoidosus.AAC.1